MPLGPGPFESIGTRGPGPLAPVLAHLYTVGLARSQLKWRHSDWAPAHLNAFGLGTVTFVSEIQSISPWRGRDDDNMSLYKLSAWQPCGRFLGVLRKIPAGQEGGRGLKHLISKMPGAIPGAICN